MKNEKGIYVVFDYKNYQNKISSQIESFKKIGLDFKIFNIKKSCIEIIYVDPKKTIDVIPISSNEEIENILMEQIKIDRVRYLYIRRLGLNVFKFKGTFKKIKKTNPEIKIAYEIPTYPFDKINNIKGKVANLIEHTFSELFILRYMDIIPVVLQDDVKLKPNMIEFKNAISPKNVINDLNSSLKITNEVKMIGIAHLNYWHGYDRLVNSLKNYDGNLKINLLIVSEKTSEVVNLEKLSKEIKNENITINFTEVNNFDQIKVISQDYHFAIGGLGYFRRKGKYDTSIKNKEYCALGLPFVIANEDKSFGKDFLYKYKVTDNEELFDISDIISWFKNVSKNDYKYEMKQYALDNLLYDDQIKLIYSALKEMDKS